MSDQKTSPLTVVITGRVNAGKSTLFNRLAGRRSALTGPHPGLTRDRREALCLLEGRSFRFIDTAGLEEAPPGTLEARMTGGSEQAFQSADLCLFLIDARAGITPADRLWSRALRKSGRSVVLVANKCEGSAAESGWLEAHDLGFEPTLALSAEHGKGMSALIEALIECYDKTSLPQGASGLEEEPYLRLAIVGRPNTGKSTLVNRLLGRERMLTGPEPGITRDSIASPLVFEDKRLLLYDTAGMRKRARITESAEVLSVGGALQAVRFADVAVLLMEKGMAFERQDLRLASLIAREGRAPVFALNKIDLGGGESAVSALSARAREMVPQLSGVETLALSALTGKGVSGLLPACLRAHKVWQTRVSTGRLNQWLKKSVERHPPPAQRGKALHLKYAVQTGSAPPSFTLFANRARGLPLSYRRYLVSRLRAQFGIEGTPIRLSVRSSKNPYVAD